MITVVRFYLLALSVVGLILMGADKLFAIKKMERTPEKTLIAIALLGGAPGAFAGMLLFRHKTRKPKFFITLPLTAVFYIALYLWLETVLV